MKLKFYLLIILLSLTTLYISCDRPDCKNTNPLFDNYSPHSREYKTELVKQLQNIDKLKLSYWFKEYVESNGQELLFFNIQGDGLCAVIVLNVEGWRKLDELRQKKGVSFKGAKFKNLEFDILQDSTNFSFILRDFERIID